MYILIHSFFDDSFPYAPPSLSLSSRGDPRTTHRAAGQAGQRQFKPDQRKMSSSELEARIAQFEALVDKNDPEQVKMLEDMKRHTALLKKGRGEWDDEAKNRWAVNSTEARSHALTLSLALRASRFVRSFARLPGRSVRTTIRGRGRRRRQSGCRWSRRRTGPTRTT